MECRHAVIKTHFEVAAKGECFNFKDLTEADEKWAKFHKKRIDAALCQIGTCEICGFTNRVCIKEFLA